MCRGPFLRDVGDSDSVDSSDEERSLGAGASGGGGNGGAGGDPLATAELGVAGGANQQEQQGAAAGGGGEDRSQPEFRLSGRQMAVAAGAEPVAGHVSVLTSPVSQRPMVYQENNSDGGGGVAAGASNGRDGVMSSRFGGAWGWEGQGRSSSGGGSSKTAVRNRARNDRNESYSGQGAPARYFRRGV